MKEIVVGVMGAGCRGTGIVKLLCETDKRIRVKSIFDPDKKQMSEFSKAVKQDVKPCSDYHQITDDPEIEWTMVMSPNYSHKDHAVASFKAGKNVFSEKPLATSIEDCQAIYDAHQSSGKVFATGFVLRYAPLYRKLREVLDSGRYGRIISIDANENITPGHGGVIMSNWRRFSKYAGPHILEKCCHDIDLLNWFVGSLPSKVASFGGRDFFTPENLPIRKKYDNSKKKSMFHSWRSPGDVDCPFESEKDIVDNQVSILEYRNRVRVQFQCTLSNAIPERRMYMTCSEGNIIAELYTGKLRAKNIGQDEPELLYDCTGGGHGGGDEVLMKELAETMLAGVAPKCGGNEGLESSVTAIAIDESRTKGAIIDMEPIWKRLGR